MPDAAAVTRAGSRLPGWRLPAVLIGLYAGLTPLLGDWRLIAAAVALPAAIALAWWVLGAPSRWFAAFCFATLLLPPLPLDWGDTGPHPAILFAALGFVAGLLRLGDWRLPRDFPSLAILVFPLVLFVSLPAALVYSGPEVFAGSFARLCLLGVGVYTFLYFAHGPGRDFAADLQWLRPLYGFAVAAAAWALMDFYFQLPPLSGYGEQFVWLAEGPFRRAQGFFYDAGLLGNFCVFFLVMVAAAWLAPQDERPGIPRWALLVGAAVLGTALFASFSRSSLLNLAAACGTLLVLYRRTLSPLRLLAVAVGGAGSVLLLALALFPRFVENWGARLWSTFAFFFETPDQVLAGRLESWATLGEFLLWNPEHWLLGIGYKTLPYTEYLGAPLIADNMYLALLVETGIVGLAGLAVFLGGILFLGLSSFRRGNPRARFLGAWAFAFWVGQLFQMISADALTYWRVLPIYFAVLSFAYRAPRGPEIQP